MKMTWQLISLYCDNILVTISHWRMYVFHLRVKHCIIEQDCALSIKVSAVSLQRIQSNNCNFKTAQTVFILQTRHSFILFDLIDSRLFFVLTLKLDEVFVFLTSHRVDRNLIKARSWKNHVNLTNLSEVNFDVPGSCPADSPRHKVLFLHYFCPGWLSNGIMNNIPAVIFNGLSPMALSCCLAGGL